MKAKDFEPINARAEQSVSAEDRDHIRPIVARWQSGLETLPGHAVRKLRLEFAPVAPTSIHLEVFGATR